ncbi:MAG TPA: esterase-like activity of phytase family protein, partial [Cyclobacteriaceae bacterium]|nr:esterase-like activity of phytase family protein [Cyclobacteriaceae bacterium]
SIEEPLYQDGPRADLVPNNSWLRIYKYDMTRQSVASQYAYLPDVVAGPAVTESGFKINGLVELLSVGPSELLTVERSFSTGRIGCTVKVFLTDFRGAEDVSNIFSLRKQPPVKPARKKLLLNFDTLGVYVDNVEGVTFGPALPNGHRTLIFIADNNFSSLEKTQVFLFEVMGD